MAGDGHTRGMKYVYHPSYQIALPAGHPFPMSKYGLLKDKLLSEGIMAAGDLALPEPIDRPTLELVHTDEYLAKLQPTCRPRQERTAALVRPGFYDDFDPALLYRGDWNRDAKGFAEPDRHTISYTNVPGSEVEIVFEGKALTYVYTKALNRGIASVTVDGVEQGPVDLYSAETQWQSRTRFCCFAPGRHVAVVRLTGRADPRSKGTYIDLDSFTVE